MKTQEFLSTLLAVKPGINVSGVSDSMGYFYFSGKSVTTFNNVISIQAPLKTDFKTFIRGNDLVNLLMGIKAETVDTKLEDNKFNIQASQGRVKINTNLNTISDNDFIKKIQAIRKSIRSAKYKELPTNFIDGIKYCSSVHVIGELDSVLSCALIDGVFLLVL